MAGNPTDRGILAITLLLTAVLETRDRSREEVEACNARFTVARDWLMHSKPRPLVTPSVQLTAQEVKSLTPDALRALRLQCRACDLCRQYGIKPP